MFSSLTSFSTAVSPFAALTVLLPRAANGAVMTLVSSAPVPTAVGNVQRGKSMSMVFARHGVGGTPTTATPTSVVADTRSSAVRTLTTRKSPRGALGPNGK